MSDPRRPEPVTLDMTPEGNFRDTPRADPIDRALGRVGRIAIGVTAVALVLTLGALAFAALTILIPLLLVAGGVAAGTLWWRLRRNGGRFVVQRR